MRRKWLAATLVTSAAALVLVAVGCGGGGGKTEAGGSGSKGKTVPVKLAFSTWNGYIGLVVGVKEGFFKKRGVDVHYTVIEDPVQRFNAFKAGKLDAIASTVDTFSRTNARGIDSVMVLGLDASVGGDGIVANKDISSASQLKGERVAVSQGSTSQWLLAYVLDAHGMSLDDVHQVDMTSGDAGAAFAAGRVPVAVTWQPWLSKAQENPDGRVLVSTKQYPAIITDQVAFQPSFIEDHPEAVRAFLRGYEDAIDLVESNPSKAFADVTGYLGQKPADIKAIMKDVPLWDLQDSRKYYGTSSSHGPIYGIFDKSARFWKSIGEISSLPNADKAIDPSFGDAVTGGS